MVATLADATILLVDDDAEFVDDLLALWRPECRILRASTPHEAVRQLVEGVPHLLLLDLRLPLGEEEGLRLLALIRREFRRQLPFIVISHDASSEARMRSMNLGADAYLSKPLNVGDLDRAVREMLLEEGSRELGEDRRC